jgi:hypothetical protein
MILEDLHAHSVFFFHQEKTFQDHCPKWGICVTQVVATLR